MSSPVSLRKMHTRDVPAAMVLSSAAGWNQTDKDWRFMIDGAGHQSIVATVDQAVIGTITAVIYEQEMAWIGMVLVAQHYRGRGISKMLLSALIDQLSDVKVIKLDATPQGQLVYGKFGFLETNSLTRMTIEGGQLQDLPLSDPNVLEEVGTNHESIIELDHSVFGARRTQLIEYLLDGSSSKSFSMKDHSGFILGREGGRFHHLGPLVASNEANAKMLIAQALQELNGKSVVIDVPQGKPDWISWLASIGFSPQRNFVRMSKNETSSKAFLENQYLIAGPEFG